MADTSIHIKKASMSGVVAVLMLITGILGSYFSLKNEISLIKQSADQMNAMLQLQINHQQMRVDLRLDQIIKSLEELVKDNQEAKQ